MNDRRRRRPALVALAALLVLAGAPAAGTATATTTGAPTEGRASPRAPAAAAAAADVLPEFATRVPVPPRVGPGVVPPTNSWISGAVYARPEADAPDPPTWVGGGLAFRSHDDGFGVALPVVRGFGDYALLQSWEDAQALRLTPPGATTYRLTRWDDLSADLTWYAGQTELGTLRAVEGWPYVMYTAATDQSVAVNRALSASGGRHTWQAGTGQVLNVVTAGTVGGGGIALDAGQSVHVFGTPQGATAADVTALVDGAVPVLGTRTEHDVSGGLARATFVLQTGGRPTVLTQMPHQDYGLPTLTGRWENATGWAHGAVGTSFTTTAKVWDVASRLDLSGLDEAQLTLLRDQVRSDVDGVLEFPADTYFGGKALYRAANLYLLAGQLGLPDEAARIEAAMTAELDVWLDADRCATERRDRCFGYDAVTRTVVPDGDAFGVSSSVNDHHFHYGYFLYAVGVLARDDPALVDRYRETADVLAQDIAALQTTDSTIQRRAFDDWRGHSWANGTGGGMDGNDQESTSEAMNAWAGLALWSEVSGDEAQQEHARWMLAFEAATARAYWWNPYRASTLRAPIVSMVFQGKSTYETWFSGDASAKTAIIVIPMGPSQLGFLSSLGEERIRAVTEPLFEGDYANRPLIDWNAALLGLADPERALAIAQGLPRVDNGNTRSYLYAVIMAGAAESAVGAPAATRLRLSAPAGPADDLVALGLALETDDGSPVPGARVVVERSRDGGWEPAGAVVTDERGRATTRLVRARSARLNVFRARWAGDPAFTASTSTAVTSTLVRRRSVLTVGGPHRARAGRRVVLRVGWRTASGAAVDGALRLQRSVDGRTWQRAALVRTDRLGRAAVRVVVPRTGARWRVVAARTDWTWGGQSTGHRVRVTAPG
ncbi:glycosyl hydrolase [Nocardioides sp. 1609]|uniref:glycosyl hydrolase n=1 Tax=Nocardioides sp. 1609 TaxID=2508327 RepID=UPI00107043E8|nr:glycosyl hydrolase [Nocardioides sp. 1609]